MAEQLNNIQFVREVEKYPCLYNYTLPDYMRRSTTETAWDEIGEKFQLTGAECKEKWKNIRTVFVRHLKPSKSGSNPAHKKSYYLAEYLQFAVPFIKLSGNVTANTTEYNPTIRQSQSIFFPEELHTTQPTLSPQSEIETGPRPLPPVEILFSTNSESTVQTQPSTSYQGKVRQKQTPERKMRILKKDIAKYLKFKQAKLAGNSKNLQQTANKMFLLSILPDMNKMNDKQKRIFKRKLLALVDDTLEDQDMYILHVK